VEVSAAATALGRELRKLPGAGDVGALRGHEGAAAAIYWPALGRLCRGAARPFRRSRPARDPLNAAINYLTSMLARDVRTALRRAGLHRGFGVLHAAADGGEACVWDVMEGFRAVASEGPAVSAFNRRRLRAEMFEPGPGGTKRIVPEGRRALIQAYEEAMARSLRSSHTGKRHALRRVLEEECRALARHLRAPRGTDWRPQEQDV
jgi:CRISPR-associated protein Cas1